MKHSMIQYYLYKTNQNASIFGNRLTSNHPSFYVIGMKLMKIMLHKTLPRVFHEDQIVLQPMDGSLRLRCNQTRQLQWFSLSESHILWLFTEEWYHTIDDLCGDSLLQNVRLSLPTVNFDINNLDLGQKI